VRQVSPDKRCCKVDDTQLFRCNPTDAVGGLFIPSLHRRSRGFRIPPTQLVDCSYPASDRRKVNPQEEPG